MNLKDVTFRFFVRFEGKQTAIYRLRCWQRWVRLLKFKYEDLP